MEPMIIFHHSQFTAKRDQGVQKGLGDVVLVVITPDLPLNFLHIWLNRNRCRIEIYKNCTSSKSMDILIDAIDS